MNETDYFFDSLRQITDWSKKANRIKDGKKKKKKKRHYLIKMAVGLLMVLCANPHKPL